MVNPTSTLAGRRVVNTRSIRDAAALDELLLARGAIPLSYPCIAIVPPVTLEPLDHALRDLAAGEYDWLILTSANAVEAVADHLAARALHLPADQPIAVVGPGTASSLKDVLGRDADFIPSGYSAERLSDELPIEPGQRALIPGSALSRPALATVLRDRGAEVDVVAAYTTIRGDGGIDLLRELRQNMVDAILFTSSSTVRFCLERLAGEGGAPADLGPVVIGCIGTETASTACELGLTVAVVPEEPTLPGLVDALEARVAESSMS